MNLEELQIRTVSGEDEATLYKMICGLENMEMDRAAFSMVFRKNLQSDHIRYFIAELAGKPVGMVSCHIQPLLHHAALVSEIQEMYVEPDYRSAAIGKALMDHVTAYAKSQSAIQMEVTSRKTRENAHRFYEREGFEKSHVKLLRYFKNDL